MRVEFKNSQGNYSTRDFEFKDQNHFDNWHNKQLRDHSYRKIVGFEKILSEKKEFSMKDMKKAFSAGLGKEVSFETFIKAYSGNTI